MYFVWDKKEGELPTNWRSYFGGPAWDDLPGTNKQYLHVFHKKQPDLNWENPELRKEVYKNINWWLDKGLGGFRIDAIINIKKALPLRSYDPDRADGLCSIQAMLREAKGIGEYLGEMRDCTFKKYDAFSVGEVFNEKPEEIPDFIGENGYFSSMFDFNETVFGSSEKGWYDAKPITPDDYKRCCFESQAKIGGIGFLSNIIENHDEPRGVSRYIPEGECFPQSKKLLAALNFMLRGLPFIYQGQELGMVNCERQGIGEFDDLSTIDQYNRSIQEGFSEAEALEMANRRSRDNARTPFPWNGEQYGGFSQAKPWLGMTEEYPAVNVQAQQHDPNSVWHFFKKMIAFRQSGPHRDCLIYGNIEPLYAGETVIAYRRLNEEDRLYCWFNLGSEPVSEPLPQADMDPVWHTQNAVRMENGMLILAPYQSVILRER